MKNKIFKQKGFTLIELMIVIAVIALLAAAVFVAVDPAKRIGQAQDAQRWQDVTAIADAIKMYMADNQIVYPTSTKNIDVYSAITPLNGGGTGGGYAIAVIGAGNYSDCELDGEYFIVGDSGAIFLNELVPTYLPTMPLNPGAHHNLGSTGYYFNRNSQGRITIGSCVESPYATASIYVQR